MLEVLVVVKDPRETRDIEELAAVDWRSPDGDVLIVHVAPTKLGALRSLPSVLSAELPKEAHVMV